jgi:hypothetical protein
LQSEILSRCIGQVVSQSLCDRWPVGRHQNAYVVSQLPDDMNAHVLALVLITQQFLQEGHHARIADPLQIDQTSSFDFAGEDSRMR